MAHLNENNEIVGANREILQTQKAMEGWSDRVMAALLAPLKNNLDKYPVGKNIPFRGHKQEKVKWDI